jgi:hypothetical protein
VTVNPASRYMVEVRKPADTAAESIQKAVAHTAAWLENPYRANLCTASRFGRQGDD